jgi:hypothetical protein
VTLGLWDAKLPEFQSINSPQIPRFLFPDLSADRKHNLFSQPNAICISIGAVWGIKWRPIWLAMVTNIPAA